VEVRGRRQTQKAIEKSWTRVFSFAEFRAGIETPWPGEGAVDAHVDLAAAMSRIGSTGGGLGGQGEQRAQHHDLVGEWVEEGPERVVPWRGRRSRRYRR